MSQQIISMILKMLLVKGLGTGVEVYWGRYGCSIERDGFTFTPLEGAIWVEDPYGCLIGVVYTIVDCEKTVSTWYDPF
jgi:hypothetical protein